MICVLCKKEFSDDPLAKICSECSEYACHLWKEWKEVPNKEDGPTMSVAQFEEKLKYMISRGRTAL